jgi:hypothetical protein
VDIRSAGGEIKVSGYVFVPHVITMEIRGPYRPDDGTGIRDALRIKIVIRDPHVAAAVIDAAREISIRRVHINGIPGIYHAS